MCHVKMTILGYVPCKNDNFWVYVICFLTWKQRAQAYATFVFYFLYVDRHCNYQLLYKTEELYKTALPRYNYTSKEIFY